MTGSTDKAAVRDLVDRTLPAFEQSSEEELLAAIGSIPLNPAFADVQGPQEFTGYGLPNFGLARLGEALLKTNKRLRGVVCDNKGAFADVVNADNITSLALAILPALGFTGVGAPPAAVVAVAVFILKIGLNEYCEDYTAD